VCAAPVAARFNFELGGIHADAPLAPFLVAAAGPLDTYVFSVLAAPVAQTCSLSVSPTIDVLRDDFSGAPPRRHVAAILEFPFWLRLCRDALYRRFSTCHLLPASNVLPITNRRYGRLKICATVNRYLDTAALLLVADSPPLSRKYAVGSAPHLDPLPAPSGERRARTHPSRIPVP
jgi:hypothetical protein